MGKFYRLETCHKTLLGFDERSGAILACAPERCGTQRHLLFAHIPAVESGTCFLISHVRGTGLHLAPHETRSAIVPLRVRRPGRGSLVSLHDPVGDRYVSAAPADDAEFGTVAADRARAGQREMFRLVPAADIFLPLELMAFGAQIDRILPAASAANSLAALLDAARPAATAAETGEANAYGAREILEAVARLLPLQRMAWLAEGLLHDPDAVTGLLEAYPDDIWATEAIPELLRWLRARREPRPKAATLPPSASRFRRVFGRSGAKPLPRDGHARTEAPPAPAGPAGRIELGPRFDVLAKGESGSSYVSLPHACNAMLRRMVQPRRDLCIVAMACNDGLYILEWLAYHRAIGVDAFFLYGNENDDGSDELLASLDDAGIITWIDNRLGPGVKPRLGAYRHALGVLPQILDYRWALAIDPDEFCVFDAEAFESVKNYVLWQEQRHPVDAIALNWIAFGPCAEARWRDDPVIRRFPRACGAPAPRFRPLCRPRLFVDSNGHFPTAYRRQPFTFRDSAGDLLRPQPDDPALSGPSRADMAWINRYRFKSAEEFLWKRWKNRGGPASGVTPGTAALTAESLGRFMEHFDARSFPDDRIIRCAPRLTEDLAALSRVRGVSQAVAKVRRTFRTQMNEIERTTHLAPAIVESGRVGRRFLETLGLVAAGS